MSARVEARASSRDTAFARLIGVGKCARFPRVKASTFAMGMAFASLLVTVIVTKAGLVNPALRQTVAIAATATAMDLVLFPTCAPVMLDTAATTASCASTAIDASTIDVSRAHHARTRASVPRVQHASALGTLPGISARVV